MAARKRRGKRIFPLIPSNVMRALRGVERWWSRSDGKGLLDHLTIPKSKQDEIRSKSEAETEQKRQSVSYWLNTDPLASWRRLITVLDGMSETKIADSLRFNAEPLTETSLTPATLLHSVLTVKNFWGRGGLLDCLGVPLSVQEQIMHSQSLSSEGKKREAGVGYYLRTVPGVSWGRIASVLWQLEEYKALETATKYLQHKQDPSHFLPSLTSALDSLPDVLWREFGVGMNVPQFTLDRIELQFQTETERKTELLKVCSSEHPQPTWEHMSDALYQLQNGSCHSVLERVQSQFPTGRRRAKQIYENEMKYGKTKRRITKVVTVGIAGSGKTTFLETVMGKKPPTVRESTPLLKRPVQTEVVFMDEKVKWVEMVPMNIQEKKRYGASLIRARAQQLGQLSPSGKPTCAEVSSQSLPVDSKSSASSFAAKAQTFIPTTLTTMTTDNVMLNPAPSSMQSTPSTSTSSNDQNLTNMGPLSIETASYENESPTGDNTPLLTSVPTIAPISTQSKPAVSESIITEMSAKADTSSIPTSTQISDTLTLTPISTQLKPVVSESMITEMSTKADTSPIPTSAPTTGTPTLTPISTQSKPVVSESLISQFPTEADKSSISTSSQISDPQTLTTTSIQSNLESGGKHDNLPMSVQLTPVNSTSSTIHLSAAPQPMDTSEAPSEATSTAKQSPNPSPKVTIESLLQSFEVEEELISLINTPTDTSDIILSDLFVYIVDSGGQPEFIEAMTVFLGETSACILVIDLSQSLDDRPMISYYRRGKPVSKPHRCIRTNEENLKQCLINMSTFTSRSKGPQTKLLFLGTHRDVLCPTETITQKNARLKKIIPTKLEKHIIRLDAKTLIFEINALNPDDTDKKMAEKVRAYILEQCPAKEVEIPVRWHAVDDNVRDMAERLGRKVMSYTECWQVAQLLGLDEASFNGALDFLHNMSLIFYFRDILPAVVFVDPQVMLDKVSEIIEFMFELRDQEELSPEADNVVSPSDEEIDCEPLPKKPRISTPAVDVDVLPPGWYEFNKFGQITKPFLNDKRFNSHYYNGIFTSDDLIHLLEELLVFAKLSSTDGEDTWFMPSVLKEMPAEKMAGVRVSSGPLVVDFPDGGPQNGIFCSLMSHVLSLQNHHPHPWKLCLSCNEPTCLYRNCIQFQVPEYGSVTLIDHYEFFEVHVSTSQEEMHELWQHVRNALFNGIETVCSTLGYSENKPRPAIICPTPHTDKSHTAYIRNGKWNCTSDMRIRGNLRDLIAEFPWCDATCRTYSASSGTSSDHTFTPSGLAGEQHSLVFASSPELLPTTSPCFENIILDVKDLQKVRLEVYRLADKWYHLGLALGLDCDTLKMIRKDNQDVSSCLCEALEIWLRKGYDLDNFPAPSWRALVEAVAHPTGGNDRALAEQIATKHGMPYSLPS